MANTKRKKTVSPTRPPARKQQVTSSVTENLQSAEPSLVRNVAHLLNELEIEMGNTAGNMNRTSEISDRLELLNIGNGSATEDKNPTYSPGIVSQLLALKEKLAAINSSTASHLNQIERHI